MEKNRSTEVMHDVISWLLEPDDDNPGIRYHTLVNLIGLPHNHEQVVEAQRYVMNTGPVPVILDAQESEGFWVEAGPGYYPKYRGTVWQIIMLAYLGADNSDPRVKLGCDYVLDHARAPYGGFSAAGNNTGMIQCLQGNLGSAFIDLGYLEDGRLLEALYWLARSITGEGIANAQNKSASVRYFRSGNSGPGFLCSANNHQPCAWGAIKALKALAKVPKELRTGTMRAALSSGVEFLFSRDPANADYPMGYSTKPSRSWFQFGFPLGYVTDVLQNLEVLSMLGYAQDRRLQPALQLICDKQDSLGRWKMEYTYNGKTWVDIEQKGKPSKWVTLRALSVLKHANFVTLAETSSY